MDRIDDAAVVRRVETYCAAMDLDMPPLEWEDGRLVLTAELQALMASEGLCYRWLLHGITEQPWERELAQAWDRMSEEERQRLLAALKHHRQHGGSLQDALRRHGFGELD